MAADVAGLIRKLRTHAESAAKIGSIAEAEAFADKVRALMTEHCLSDRDVEAHEPHVQRRCWPRRWRAQLYHWEWLLAMAAAECCYVSPAKGKGNELWFCGLESNCGGAAATYEYLLTAVRVGSRFAVIAERRGDRRRLRTEKARAEFMSSYRLGFARAVLQRASEDQPGIEQAGLIRLNSIRAAAKQYAEQFTKPGKGYSPKIRNREAFIRGHMDGEKFDLRRSPRLEAAGG